MMKTTSVEQCAWALLCQITKGTLASELYGSDFVEEQHKHRYEVNIAYQEKLEKQD